MVPDSAINERLLAEAVSHLAEGVLITDDELAWPGPRIVFVNEAMCRISGYSADELLGQSPRVLQGRETDRRTLDWIRAELTSGRACRAEIVNYRQNGDRYDAELFITPLFNDDGQRTNFVSIHHDVTERKRTEREFRESRERLRAVVDTAVEAIVTIDRRGTVASFNRAAEQMFGYSADEVIGRNVSMLMPSPFREQHTGHLDRYLQTGEARIIGIGRETIAQRKDGSTFPIELSVSESEHLQMFTGMIRDISERMETEERLRQADRLSSIGTLAAGLGHDMNNMLLPVRARLDLIDQAELPHQVRQQFIEIRKSTKYLQDLADALHLLALDPEDAEASEEISVLDDWWRQTHTLLRRALPKHVRFSASMPSDLPAINVPPHRLTQAILNMLVNAATAVDEGGRVRLWADLEDDNGLVRLGVSDDGCGMTEEIRRRALEPFFTTKKRGLGTGLGLSLVHSVVLAGHGTIEIQSKPAEGTTIILRFPRAQREPDDELHGGQHQTVRAAVSLDDHRLESLVLTLLEAGGIDACQGMPDQSRRTSIWFTDASHASADTVRAMIDRGCRIILLGPVAADWHEMEVDIIDEPYDFESLRLAVSRVTEGVAQ